MSSPLLVVDHVHAPNTQFNHNAPLLTADVSGSETETDSDMEISRMKEFRVEPSVKVNSSILIPSEEGEASNRKNPEPSTDLFKIIFSPEDEIAVLSGLIKFVAERKVNPLKNLDEFHQFIKNDLNAEFSDSQLDSKIKKFKYRFVRGVERKERKGKARKITSLHNRNVFDLSKKIWTPDGKFLNVDNTRVYGRRKKINVIGSGTVVVPQTPLVSPGVEGTVVIPEAPQYSQPVVSPPIQGQNVVPPAVEGTVVRPEARQYSQPVVSPPMEGFAIAEALPALNVAVVPGFETATIGAQDALRETRGQVLGEKRSWKIPNLKNCSGELGVDPEVLERGLELAEDSKKDELEARWKKLMIKEAEMCVKHQRELQNMMNERQNLMNERKSLVIDQVETSAAAFKARES